MRNVVELSTPFGSIFIDPDSAVVVGETQNGTRCLYVLGQHIITILGEFCVADHVLTAIECCPHLWAPRNPHYQKNHVSAPGTVRSWFRKMRAADFERDAAKATSTEGGFFWKVHEDLQGWTLFDTQKVIDRETAHVYAPEPIFRCRLDTLYFLALPKFGESPDEWASRCGVITHIRTPDA